MTGTRAPEELRRTAVRSGSGDRVASVAGHPSAAITASALVTTETFCSA